jgi:hypothetical protein
MAVAAAVVAPLLVGRRAPTPTFARRGGGAASARPGEVRVLTLPTGFRPGGVAACGGTLFATSLADGQVVRLDLRTGLLRTLLPGAAGRSLHGAGIDPRSGLLFAVGSHGRAGLVLAVDRRSGVVVRRWDVPDAGRLADLAITADAVWVTDSRLDRLLRIGLRDNGTPLPGGTAQLALSAPWPARRAAPSRAVGARPGATAPSRHGPGRGGAHGIRPLPDGDLLLDHSSAGGLWSVHPPDGEVRPVPVTGGPRVSAGDGLELNTDRVWVVGGTSRHGVAELRLDDHHGRLTARWVRELTDRRLENPSTAAVSGGRLWAAGTRLGVPDPARCGYWVAGLPLGRR